MGHDDAEEEEATMEDQLVGELCIEVLEKLATPAKEARHGQVLLYVVCAELLKHNLQDAVDPEHLDKVDQRSH